MKDIQGVPFKVGQRVAYAGRLGHGAELKIGEIKAIRNGGVVVLRDGATRTGTVNPSNVLVIS